MTGSGFSNIHTCLRAFWMLRRFDFWWNLRVYVWALMFHFHDRLRDLKHTYRLRRCFRRIFVATQTCFWACMYVCLKQFSMTGRGFSNIHTRSRAPGKAFRYGKSTNCVCMFDLCMYVWGIHTCLRASNIHTYWEFARRINIDLNCCAPNFQKICAAILFKRNGLFLKGN